MSFNLPYKFQTSGRIVVLHHSHNGHIRVSPNNMGRADGGGQTGHYAQWKIHLCGGPYIRLQSTKTGKYLRIFRGGKEIDCNGGTGPFTKFKYHIHSRPNGIKLESDRFPGRYIAVNPNRTMKIGSGGHHCNIWIKREGGGGQHHKPKPHYVKPVVIQQPKVIYQTQNTGQPIFAAPYMFRQNNTIVIKSNYGKHLRVSPNNTYNCDGNGGTGKYARWRIHLESGGVIKLQNTHTNKYLRIEKNNAVNCGGTGGQLTRFRYHVHTHPNGVKLQSCRFPGKYVAIRPNGMVMHGTGGIHTQLTFLRQGGQQVQQKIVIQQQPVQPQIIVQQPVRPQVIVQQPQQTYQQQQLAQQQQQMAQQQQLAQQQMAQQMEQMKLQNEASLKQQQQMELEKQRMQQQMELQRQQMQAQQQQVLDAQKVMLEQQQAQLSNQNIPSPQNEGVSSSSTPYNPYYGNTVVQNEVQQQQQPQPPMDNNVVSYPVLNDDNKQPDVIEPYGGSDAANDVLTWLTQLKMERYYNTFIENGYDQLESIGDIAKEDLKEMGVALGHIKIIVSASITAPFLNKNVKIKSIRYDTYLHEYGKPKNMNNPNGMRCILQHNDKKDLPGCIWKFEILEDNYFRLKHVPTQSWLRIIKNDGEVDTRSPFDKWSKLALEKDEKSKGVYYIKEMKQDNYVRFDEPRSFGYNKVEGKEKRDNNCKIKLEIVKQF